MIAALAITVVFRRERSGNHAPLSRSIVAAMIAVALVGAIGTMVQVGRIGHSGATASWSDVGTPAKP